jgi:hypothetical protein
MISMERAGMDALVALMNNGQPTSQAQIPKENLPKGVQLEIGRVYDFVDANGKHRGVCVEIIEKGFLFKEITELHFLMPVRVGENLEKRVVCYQRKAIDYIYEVD